MKKKLLNLLMAAAIVLALTACGGGSNEPNMPGTSGGGSSSQGGVEMSDEELITAAQRTYFENFEEKTIGEYIEESDVFTKKEWAVIQFDELTEKSQELLKKRGYIESHILVCGSLGTEGDADRRWKFFVSVNPETKETMFRVCIDEGKSYASEEYVEWFLNMKQSAVMSVEELETKAEECYFPGYADVTAGEYAKKATLLAGSYNVQYFAPTDANMSVYQMLCREVDEFHIETDKLVTMKVWTEDLQGNPAVNYIFYIAVDRNTGDAKLVAANIEQDKKSRTFYGEKDAQQVVDIFVEFASWAG